ncbi:hypothetical protein DAPPUDRAFT_115412 [Daphnia pulex]|uniref:Uncharacterized protein n=1 Tax=Daphnia pulex TaxID=6669 RepID=E9HL92_DAPPU|nr:hypothetical protein DAPPUDRAFT_115412 [Daphnia pulex]|eukprot:EFX67490.1 hypothetical protein DAPPUDRAFT_115412 [Daphnia pulex]
MEIPKTIRLHPPLIHVPITIMESYEEAKKQPQAQNYCDDNVIFVHEVKSYCAHKKLPSSDSVSIHSSKTALGPADCQPYSKIVVNVNDEESNDSTAVETLPAATEGMILLSDFVSVDTFDVHSYSVVVSWRLIKSAERKESRNILLSPVTTATINNNLTIVSNVSKVSNVEEKVSVDSILSGATTPSETGCVSGYSVPSSLRSRKIISFEEETKVELVEKGRLSLEEMERYSERDRLRAEQGRLLEQKRQRQERLEKHLADEEFDWMAIQVLQAKEECFQKYISKISKFGCKNGQSSSESMSESKLFHLVNIHSITVASVSRQKATIERFYTWSDFCWTIDQRDSWVQPYMGGYQEPTPELFRLNHMDDSSTHTLVKPDSHGCISANNGKKRSGWQYGIMESLNESDKRFGETAIWSEFFRNDEDKLDAEYGEAWNIVKEEIKTALKKHVNRDEYCNVDTVPLRDIVLSSRLKPG